jgi:hypothetical protein
MEECAAVSQAKKLEKLRITAECKAKKARVVAEAKAKQAKKKVSKDFMYLVLVE